MKIKKINISKIIGITLFIIAWTTGAVSGILAWAILLLFIDLTFDINKL